MHTPRYYYGYINVFFYYIFEILANIWQGPEAEDIKKGVKEKRTSRLH